MQLYGYVYFIIKFGEMPLVGLTVAVEGHLINQATEVVQFVDGLRRTS